MSAPAVTSSAMAASSLSMRAGARSGRGSDVSDGHDDVFRIPLTTRYLEFDQQGVVFNMWYLAYFEDARNAFLTHIGYPLSSLLAAGLDVQLVRSEIDWSAPVRYGQIASVTVRASDVGRTSFTLDFDVLVQGESRVRARTVYVVVDGRTFRKHDLPTELRAALP
jgi:acyl-CoA thioester hydrolase